MKYQIVYCLVFVFIFSSCNKSSNNNKIIKQEIIEYKCAQLFDPVNINSFRIKKNYNWNKTFGWGDPIFEIGYEGMSYEEQFVNLQGSISKINETEIKTSIRFDEPYEEIVSETEYKFNNRNMLRSIKGKNVSVEYSYNKNDVIQESVTDIRLSQVKDNYSEDSLLTVRTRKYLWFDENKYNWEYRVSDKFKKEQERFKSKDYSKASIKKTKYFYDTTRKVIKEIHYPNYHKLDDIRFKYSSIATKNDSIVIKYVYNRNNISEAIEYNEEGKKIAYTYFKYDNVKNTLILSNFVKTWNDEDKASEINYFFDENCYLKKITSVRFSGDTKYCEKYVLNSNGRNEHTSFELKNRKNKDFKYYDDDEEYIRDNSLKKETKFFKYYTLDPKYKYDTKGNWITKTSGDQIIRRKIAYR